MISSFSLEAILNARRDQVISPIHKSKLKYFAVLENSFLVLPDGKTIIGVEYGDKFNNSLVMEDITDSKDSFLRFGNHRKSIYAVLFVKETNSLFSGDENGDLFEYKLDKNRNVSLVKHYGNIGIGTINSGVYLGSVLILGGNKSLIRVLDMGKKVLVGKPFKTAVEFNHSLRLCKTEDSRVLFITSGILYNYTNFTGDIFDASELFSYYSVDTEVLDLESSDEETETISNEPKKELNLDNFESSHVTTCLMNQFFKYLEELLYNFYHLITKQYPKKVEETHQSEEKLIMKVQDICSEFQINEFTRSI